MSVRSLARLAARRAANAAPEPAPVTLLGPGLRGPAGAAVRRQRSVPA